MKTMRSVLTKMQQGQVADDWRNGIWTAKDGQRIPVCKIDDGHLINIYRHLLKQSRRIARNNLHWYLSCPEPNGEMAQLAFEQELMFWEGETELEPEYVVLESHPFYEHLIKEIEKRRIKL